MNRRSFVLASTTAAVGLGCRKESPSETTPETIPTKLAPPENRSADILIVGGGFGGCAAALAACRVGANNVIMTEETVWIGGQLTSQLVPMDEHKFIEGGGSTATYQELRNRIRKIYQTRTDKPLRKEHVNKANLNPGEGWVSRLCMEPIVGLQAITDMLKPYIASGKLTILHNTVATKADINGNKVKAVTFKDTKEGHTFTIEAKYVIDGTEEGDLLPMTKTEFVTGSESKKTTGEPNASDRERPGNIQSFTWCFMLEHRGGEEHVIEKPKGYDFWKEYPKKDEPLFQWEKPKFSFNPAADKDPGQPDRMNFWTYRRVVAQKLFAPGSYPGDVSCINYHLNDYALGSSHAGTPEENAKHRAASKEMSQCLLYWLQTESPRSDGKKGWPGLRLSPEQAGSPDGYALAPYIRESRRIVPVTRIVEQHLRKDIRDQLMGKDKARAEVYPDSVGIGLYLYMDLHKTCEGDHGAGGPIYPFQIPLGSLLPVRTENLLPACKNLGTTHLTNGCYRLHPVEWNIGESAGALAAYCLAKNVTPKQVKETDALLKSFQKQLTDIGVRLEWPEDQVRG